MKYRKAAFILSCVILSGATSCGKGLDSGKNDPPQILTTAQSTETSAEKMTSQEGASQNSADGEPETESASKEDPAESAAQAVGEEHQGSVEKASENSTVSGNGGNNVPIKTARQATQAMQQTPAIADTPAAIRSRAAVREAM